MADGVWPLDLTCCRRRAEEVGLAGSRDLSGVLDLNGVFGRRLAGFRENLRMMKVNGRCACLSGDSGGLSGEAAGLATGKRVLGTSWQAVGRTAGVIRSFEKGPRQAAPAF
jgi:hypothetical protein